jgi:putative endonuclease
MFYLYLLHNLDSKSSRRFYVGITKNLDRRVLEHNLGTSNYTSKFGPWKLVYYEAYLNQQDAIDREYKLKHHGKGLSEIKKRLKASIDETKKVRDN